MRRTAAATAVVALLLAGCTDQTPDPSEPTSPIPTSADATTTIDSPEPTPTSEEAVTPSPTPAGPSSDDAGSTSPASTTSAASPTPEEDDIESLHPWLTGPSEQEATGSATDRRQEITNVRVGEHDGYDRVVFDLSGDQPQLGWFAGFTEEAIEDPTGAPLDVEGETFLQLGIHGIDWMRDAPERYSGATVDGDELEVVEEVVFGGLFEAQQQILIGLDEQTAYRVFALADPARIVVDVRHD